ncbi:probable RNA-binding protein EIF1AD isoform X2 [Limulus polyphemus]|uniref:Probable RNA-binding protein EIF1AD n=1 Tax=Limulus polyphemus TaxID=6850 RepID=A0ABM1BQG2_LIMPO|nr:probable RNA-binding protein EIF1AD isoform X2 [Limulus polyphemus]
MSKTTKKKHVAKEVLDTLVVPEGEQQIVRVICGKGNNLHEVESDVGEKFLVSMPTKFRKNVWIKRGDFVIVEPIEEGDKVKAEIVHILYKDQIKHIKSEGKWPVEFEETKILENNCCDDPNAALDSDEDNDSDLFVNRNRPDISYNDDSDTSSESEDESCE